MNHEIVVFVSKVHLAHVVVQNGLILGDEQYDPVSSWDTPASNILLSNILPTLSEEEILQKLGQSVLWCRELLKLPSAPWMESLNISKRLDGFAMLF